MTSKNEATERRTKDDAAAMATRPALADIAVAPRLLTREQAAAYCSVGLRTFTGLCPVQPIALGASKRLQRYDVRAIDQWIDTLGSDHALTGKDWLKTLEAEHDDCTGEGS